MTSIRALIEADPQGFLEMEPEEVAGHLLIDLQRQDRPRSGQLHLHNFTLRLGPEQCEVVAEAWSYLEREGLIAERTAGWFFVARRGRRIKLPEEVDAIRRTQFPDALLHPDIVHRCRRSFITNDFDTAVFNAFKAVEVRVRECGGFTHEVVGEKLMRKAFNADNGPLADRNVPVAERKALENLAAGAFGCFRNSTGHRDTGYNDAAEAIEMIGLASLLLRIVDRARDRASERDPRDP